MFILKLNPHLLPLKRMGLCCMNGKTLNSILKPNTFGFHFMSSKNSPIQHRLRNNPFRFQIRTSILSDRSSFDIKITEALAYRYFKTSDPRRIGPGIWIVLRPVLKLTAVLTGRGIRKWWRDLPPNKKKYFFDEIKSNRRKIGIALSIIVLLSLSYYLSHLEETPITKRIRFMAFTESQMKKINEYELQQIMEQLGEQVLPLTHPETRRVAAVVKRIVDANTDIKEIGNKKFGVAVIDSSVENAFVLPIGFVFVFTGMLNLCSNDDQLAIILSHEIAHSIQNHGAENVSFAHILDLFSIVIIAAIWAVVPSDSISLLTHYLYQKSIKILLELPYNRKIETEADKVGLQLAAKACFDVRESSAFWSKMALLKSTFGNTPEIEFLSTHPSHEKRSEYLDGLMDEAITLRKSCGCPRLSYRDPRNDVETVSKALEMARIKYFEKNAKPENILIL